MRLPLNVRQIRDIAYASLSFAQKLDIYLPNNGEALKPVIVSIHGGAFMEGDKADSQVLPMLEGLRQGYAVVSVNYRMSGEAKFPALVQDVKAAIRWIRANANQYRFDSQKIAAWGGSAGGYLATMLGVTGEIGEFDDPKLGNPDQSSNVQAVVTWFAPTDFLKMDEQLIARHLRPSPGNEHNGPSSPESLLLGEQIIKIPELGKIANPEIYIGANVPPFLIQHGTCDDIVPVDMSIHFAAKLPPDRVELELLEGAGHADPCFETSENIERVLSFLGQHLK
jgi:acetyl esterase/lipase